MVSAKLEIVNLGKEEGTKKYILIYVADDYDPTRVIIGEKLYYDKIITLRNLIKKHGGANRLKKEILLGNITYRNGVYSI